MPVSDNTHRNRFATRLRPNTNAATLFDLLYSYAARCSIRQSRDARRCFCPYASQVHKPTPRRLFMTQDIFPYNMIGLGHLDHHVPNGRSLRELSRTTRIGSFANWPTISGSGKCIPIGLSRCARSCLGPESSSPNDPNCISPHCSPRLFHRSPKATRERFLIRHTLGSVSGAGQAPRVREVWC